MSDRWSFQFTKSLVPEKFLLDGYVSIGSTGELSPATQTLPIWMKSITHNSTGNYTVVLTDTWSGVVLPVIEVIGAAALDGVRAQVLSATASQFVFACFTTSTLAPVDPSSGGGLQFILHVVNSNSL